MLVILASYIDNICLPNRIYVVGWTKTVFEVMFLYLFIFGSVILVNLL